ncbi:MAG: HEAT repeat domain-containing protein [Deferribacteres bacterium]|nr:HEAT repeat domain-containing protein [Deferribacteres bacterium]
MLSHKYFQSLFVIVLLFYATPSFTAANDSGAKQIIDFDIYEKIKSVSQDTQCICLRYIIQEPEKIDDCRIIFDVMAIYQKNSIVEIRLLAIKALEKVGNKAAIEFLKNAYHKQANPELRKAIWVSLNKISA